MRSLRSLAVVAALSAAACSGSCGGHDSLPATSTPPTITSLDPAIQEMAGDAVIAVPSDDTMAIANAMVALIGDEARRRELSERGIERAAAFHWRETARRTREIYVAACGLD